MRTGEMVTHKPKEEKLRDEIQMAQTPNTVVIERGLLAFAIRRSLVTLVTILSGKW